MIQFVRAGSIVLAACALAVFRPPAAHSQQRSEYDRESAGTRMLELASGTSIRMLLDASNLGSGEVEVAEITFPAGMSPTGAHRHTAIEIFYVIEGVLGHVVNGEEHRIEPGRVGVVKPGDEVVHRVVGSSPVRALVIQRSWTPFTSAVAITHPLSLGIRIACSSFSL